MNVGSGIGGALVIDGRLHDGQGLGAFEMGHTRITEIGGDGALRQMKLEDLCSGWAIEHTIRARAPKMGTPLFELCGGHQNTLTCAMLGQAAERGDAAAIHHIEIVAERLARAIANAITLIHPERFAIGGGVSLMGEVLLEPLRRHVHEYVFEPYREKYQIVPAALGEDVVLVGALLLAGG
jgi:glucokinase